MPQHPAPHSEFLSSMGAVLVPIQGDSFVMGSDDSDMGHPPTEPNRVVSLNHPYFIGRTPITQSQFRRVTGQAPSFFGEAGDDAPVESVRHANAVEFCNQLTLIDREQGIIPDGFSYRLPYESEWEFACRGGNQSPQYGNLDDIAWHHGNANESTQRVGQKQPNAFGLHDMIGNVWEMCLDWYSPGAKQRAARGGSWFNTTKMCQAASRENYNGGRYCGFRIVASRCMELTLTPAVDQLLRPKSKTIHDAILCEDLELAESIVSHDHAALESWDSIPPPAHWCIYNEKPNMLAWLLDRGAQIERCDQDYGIPPLHCAVVMRQSRCIELLVERGADSSYAMDVAIRGTKGQFEDHGLDAGGYATIVELLNRLL